MDYRISTLLASVALLMLALGGAALATDGGTDAGATPQGVAPFSLTDVTPDGGETSAAVDGGVTVDFNRPIRISTLTDGSARIREVGTSKWRNFRSAEYDESTGTVLLFAPGGALQPDTAYQVAIYGGKTGVRAQDGSRLAGVDDPTARFRDGRVVWGFRTAP